MNKLRLGIIGTGWITEKFIKDATQNGHYQLAAIFSRTIEKASEFSQKINEEQKAEDVTLTDNLDELFDTIDIVYIASPNSLHFSQIEAAIEANVHVIVEKPALVNIDEFEKIQELLETHPNIYFFEAARHIYTDNFQAIKSEVAQLPKVTGAVLNFQQYSSKFPDYLAGKNPNVFSREFAAGALYDLGVYVIYAAIEWFGLPQAVQYTPTLLDGGADGRGAITLVYDGYQVTGIVSKMNASSSPTEIYSYDTRIQANSLANIAEVRMITPTTEDIISTDPEDSMTMSAEADEFYRIISDQDKEKYQELLTLAKNVNKVMFDLRQSAGIAFPNND